MVEGDIPEDAVFSDSSVAAYASLNDFAFNFGHAMYDILFPAFNVMQLLNIYTPDFQLVLAQQQVSSSFGGWAGCMQNCMQCVEEL